MKVKVEVTVDIDVEAWCLNYCTDPSEVRQDVKEHLAQAILMHVESLGVGTPA